MSEQLACAECGKSGGLGEVVRVETSGWVPCKVYAKPGGGVEVKRGDPENVEPYGGDVTQTDDIECCECGATFDTWDEATADKAVEYRCETCGWWGLQDWLHVDCDGELAQVKHPRLAAA